MSINDNSFDIDIRGNSFCIVEAPSDVKSDEYAINTLSKIEYVVKNRLNYCSTTQDKYSSLTKSQLLEVLKKTSSDLRNSYIKKQEEVNWISRTIFSKEKQVNAIYTRIENYISPAPVFPLNNDAIYSVTQFLGMSALTLEQVSLHGKAHAERCIIESVQELGYEGNNAADAKVYLQELLDEIDEARKEAGFLPEKYIVTQKIEGSKNGSIMLKDRRSIEKTLQNLNDLTSDELFAMIMNRRLYSKSFQKLMKLMAVKGSKMGLNALDKAFIFAVKNEGKAIVELLLKKGANINQKRTHGTALHYAALSGDLEIAKLLVENGADIHAKDSSERTALDIANRNGNKELALFLQNSNE